MSEQVKRYKVWEADLVLPDDSEVVLASDYAALQAECEWLRAELKGESERVKILVEEKYRLVSRARSAERGYSAACKELWAKRQELAALKEKGAMN